MANIIDIAVGKQAQAEVDKLIASLKLTHEEIIKINQQGLKINSGASPKNPVQMNASVKETIALTEKLDVTTKKLTDTEKKLQQERLKELQIQKQREDAVDKYNAQLEKSYQKQINESNKIIAQKEKEFAKFEKQFNEYEANLSRQAIAEQTARKKQVQAILDQSKALNSLEAQKQKELASLEKENSKLAIASNAYNKLQAELSKLQFAYQNLAVRKEQGVTLTKAEAQQYDYLKNRIQQHDKTLKAVDATMGKHQRNVGNYASAFNPLQNSINQLGREMPAFANSVQTGFMAISNNLPIFFDALSQTTAEVNRLKKAGLETPSVFSKLTSSLFSFQTLLSVGVTLLTVYGAEIINWISNLGNANEKLIEMIRLQEELDNSRRKSTVKITNDIKEYERALSIITDKKQKKDYRLQEIKDLRNIYSYYLKDISDADLLEQKNTETKKKVANAFNEIKKAISAKEKASETNNILKQNEERLLKLKEEEKLRIKELSDLDVLNNKLENRKNLLYENNQGSLYTSGNDSVTNSILKQIKAIEQDRKTRLKKYEEQKDALLADKDGFKITNEIFALETRLQQLRQTALNNTNASIGLRIKENKESKKTAEKKKEKIDLNFREIESEYDLRRAILERQKAEISDRMDNESLNLNDRLKAREEFSKKSIELLDLELRKEKEVLLFKQAEDFSKNNLALKNKEISYAQYSENIKDINKRVSNEIATSDLAYSLKWNNLLNSDAEFYKKIQEQKVRFTNDTNKLILDSETKKFEKISKDETKTLLTRNLSHQKYIDNSKQQLQIDKMLEMSKSTSQEQLDNIIKKYQLLGEALDELATPYETARKGFEDYLKSITSNELDSALNKIGVSSLKMFLNIDENGQTTFSKMWELAETTQEKFALAFKGIGDVFQEVAGLMSQASQQRHEEELYRLEQQKNVSLQFAGESATAREEIERQYEERKKAIQRRQAEAQKKLAIFNVAIDTAQAVVSALAKVAFPKNIVVAGLMASLGAAQIAMISNQEIPAFWRGTENAPEGLAWTQEKGAEVITDKKGNIKTLGNNKGAQLTYLEKGDKVYKSHQDYINKTLVGAGIQPMRENNSLTSSDFNNGISKLAKTMQSNKGSNTQVFFNNKQIDTNSLRGIGKKV